MKNHYQFLFEKEKEQKILDYLKSKGFSSRSVTRIKKNGRLLLNGKNVRFIDTVKNGDRIDVYLPEEHIDIIPEDYPLDIVYEDEEVLVVNKPPLLVTHPTEEYQESTLAHYVAGHFVKTGQNVKVRFVNRLDRDTTGIIVIAKNQFVQHYIQSRMKTDRVKKSYILYTDGNVKEDSGEIDLPIYRPAKDSIERIVDERGQPSKTLFKKIEDFNGSSKLECQLETGRTHQLRVHMKALGTPIIGDPLYNPDSIEKYDFQRQALHAYRLELDLPKSGHHVFYAPLPDDLINLENSLRS